MEKNKNKNKNKFMLGLSILVLSSGIFYNNITENVNEDKVLVNGFYETVESKYSYVPMDILENYNKMVLVSSSLEDTTFFKDREFHRFIEEKSGEEKVDSFLMYVIFYNDVYVLKNEIDGTELDKSNKKFMERVEELIVDFGAMNRKYNDDALNKFVEKYYGGSIEVYEGIINLYEDTGILHYLDGLEK